MDSRNFFRVVRKRKWVIIASAVVVALAAAGVSYMQPKQFAGVASVLVAEQGTSAANVFERVLPGLSSQPERALQTEVQLMQQRPIAAETIRALNLEVTPDKLLKKVTVVEIGQTNVVNIVAPDSSAETAAAIANSVAGQYVAQSQDVRRKSIGAAVRAVELRMKELNGQVVALRRRMTAKKKSPALESELRATTDAYSALSSEFEQLSLNEQLETGAGTVVAEAIPDTRQVAPSPLSTGALALAVGLAFGLVVAFALEHIEDSKSGA